MPLDKSSDQTFESRLASYSRSAEESVKSTLTTSTGYFAGAAAVLALGTTEAEAVLTIVDVNQVLNPASGSSEQFSLDIAGFGVAADFIFQAQLDEAAFNNRDWFRMGGTTETKVVGSSYSVSFNYVSRLSLGDTLNTALAFVDGDGTTNSYLASSQNSFFTPSGQWLGGNQGYVGFQLTDGGQTYLGWIEVRVDADNGGGEIIRYAIEDDPTVTSLTVGVPEPSSLACLAMGAAGLLRLRQRRKNVA